MGKKERNQVDWGKDDWQEREGGQPQEHAEPGRTGAEQEWEPEDLAVAEGRDPTPKNARHAAREMTEEGRAAIDRTVP